MYIDVQHSASEYMCIIAVSERETEILSNLLLVHLLVHAWFTFKFTVGPQENARDTIEECKRIPIPYDSSCGFEHSRLASRSEQ